MSHKDHPFYGEHIFATGEQEKILEVLAKYRKREVNDQLKKDIWQELTNLRHQGVIKIPFKVILRQDPTGKFAPQVEVLLDTKL